MECFIEFAYNDELVFKRILYFHSWSFLYGGTESLIKLIEPFNIKIIRVES